MYVVEQNALLNIDWRILDLFVMYFIFVGRYKDDNKQKNVCRPTYKIIFVNVYGTYAMVTSCENNKKPKFFAY